MRGLLACLLLLCGFQASAQEPLSFKIISSDPVQSARVELIFEQRRVNDEGVDAFDGVVSEPRESIIHARGHNLWEIEVILKPEDFKRHPTAVCMATTESGNLLAFPAQIVGKDVKRLQSDTVGTVSCLKDPAVLSATEIEKLPAKDRNALIRSRDIDSEKLAREIMGLLTESLAIRIHQEEVAVGIATPAPLTPRSKVEEIVRRLVSLDSVLPGL